MATNAARMDAPDAASAPPAEPWTIARLRELGVRLRSVNVLAHGELREPIDIKRLALLVRNADYKPRGFGALVLRFHEPKGSVLVYKSGKFIVVGSKTPDHARTIADKFSAVLQKVEFPCAVAKFVVANIVNATDLRFPLRLEGLAHKHAKHCQFEPELFPGLIYRLLDPQVTLLVFVSGKVVITGSRTQKDADRAMCKLFPVFLQYRMRRDMDDDLSLSDDSSEAEGGDGDDEAIRENDDDDDDDDFLNEL